MIDLPVAPPVYNNREMYDYITSHTNKDHILSNLKILGEGAAGTTFSANVKKQSEKIVLKEMKRTRFAKNEQKALTFLREKMLAGELPGYYIFMFDYYISGSNKYLLLEKAKMGIDDYLEMNDLEPKEFYRLFWSIADAVDHLEKIEFNHGDLWSENIMLTFPNGKERVNDYHIKIIDYDCAYHKGADIVNPCYGGADKFRKRFILGYDLSRFFDGLMFAYNDMLKKYNRETRKIKSREKCAEIWEEYLMQNIRYPQSILDFIISLEPNEPNYFKDNVNTSGAVIKEKIALLLSK